MDINWDGIGAPPVGAVCEVRAEHIREGDWTEVKVLARGLHEKDVAVLVAEHVDGLVNEMHCILYSGFEDHFRPIKTKEQPAAEEREKAIEDMVALVVKGQDYSVQAETGTSTADYVRDTCKQLHDAGYRRSSHEH